MPLGALERTILKLLAQNRSPDSYLGGATVINTAAESPRFSKDVDLFHDTAESVARCAQADVELLRANGFRVEWVLNQPTFQRAEVEGRGERLRMEWVFDSAFRFFPLERDPDLGYRLNFWDAATNKVLALAGRAEPRDFVDVLYLHENHLHLGALSWAASGKDEGLNPVFILQEARRSSRYTQAELNQLHLAKALDVSEMKQRWLRAVAEAEDLVHRLPAPEIGCLYLDAANRPVNPDPGSNAFSNLRRHRGSIRGAWPEIKPVK